MMHLSETRLHDLSPTLFSILSNGQLRKVHVSLLSHRRRWLPAGWLAQRQINTSVHESCSPHTPKTIAGGLCAGRPGLLSSQSAHTALLFVSHRTGDVFQSRGFRGGKKEKTPALLLCTKLRAYCGTKFHRLAWIREQKQSDAVLFPPTKQRR